MATTFIQLIKDFCARRGLPVPVGVVGNQEATVAQLLALTHAVVEDLQQYTWDDQIEAKTFVAAVGEDQGTLLSLFGAGYRALIPNTLWNMTQRRPICGPITDTDYQYFKGMAISGSLYYFKVMGGKLLLVPAMGNPSDTLSALFKTNFVVKSQAGAGKARVDNDTDTFVVPDNVFKLELEWRWLKDKGQAWAASRLEAKEACAHAIMDDNWLPTLNLSTGEYNIKPGIWVPAGSWPS